VSGNHAGQIKISSPSASFWVGCQCPISGFPPQAHEDSAERGRCGASLKQSFLAAAQRPQGLFSVSIYTFFKDIVMLVCVFRPFAGSLLI
jgi:hypothetical protein